VVAAHVRPVLAAAAALALAGCSSDHSGKGADDRRTFQAYVAQVERVRLPVNDLLEQADPILSGYRSRRLGAAEAQRRMNALEHRFAAYTVQIATVRPVPAAMRAAQDAYAHTYVLEDSYLSALTSALPGRRFDDLPHTANDQRAAVVMWRTRLQIVATQLGVSLPADIDAAGRGEIAPSPLGS
jgi:hypothetical protein